MVSRLHVYTVSQGPRRVEKSGGSNTAMASARARAYNGGLGEEPPAGVQGAEPSVGGQEADEVLVFKTPIFNASASFARNPALFELLLL